MKPTVTAHTGCLNTKANTLASIEAGFASGADIVEIDIRFRADGEPILTHNKLSGEEEQSAVLLADAFDLIRQFPDKKVNLDLKETSNMVAIQRLAEAKGVLGQVFFTGVFPNFVPDVKEGTPKIPYYLNMNYSAFLAHFPWYVDRMIKKAKQLGAIGLNLNKTGCTPKLIRKTHEAKLLVSVWTMTDSPGAQKYLAMKPDNITCKNPDEVLSLLAKD